MSYELKRTINIINSSLDAVKDPNISRECKYILIGHIIKDMKTLLTLADRRHVQLIHPGFMRKIQQLIEEERIDNGTCHIRHMMIRSGMLARI